MIIIVVALAILAVAAYLFIQSKKPDAMMEKETTQDEMMQEDTMMEGDEVSESTKTDVIESELDSTTVGSIDSDLNELEVDASSL